jgi:hypothetical protein
LSSLKWVFNKCLKLFAWGYFNLRGEFGTSHTRQRAPETKAFNAIKLKMYPCASRAKTVLLVMRLSAESVPESAITGVPWCARAISK